MKQTDQEFLNRIQFLADKTAQMARDLAREVQEHNGNSMDLLRRPGETLGQAAMRRAKLR